MSNFENIELDLSEQDISAALMLYFTNILSPESMAVFEEAIENNESHESASYKAVLNQALLEIIEAAIADKNLVQDEGAV